MKQDLRDQEPERGHAAKIAARKVIDKLGKERDFKPVSYGGGKDEVPAGGYARH